MIQYDSQKLRASSTEKDGQIKCGNEFLQKGENVTDQGKDE
jgi:hypothetical protein